MKNCELTPRNILLDLSKPAANTLAVYGGSLSMTMRQAYLEMVLFCVSGFKSRRLFPGAVSVTTKSILESAERPICEKKASQIKYSTKTKFDTVHSAMIILKWNVNIQLYDARFLQMAAIYTHRHTANLFLNDSHCSTVKVNVTLFCGYQYI